MDFLDIYFDLNAHKYSPYKKPNNKLIYVNKKSNHPPTVIKQIPGMIEDRISKRSAGATEFEKVEKDYNKALEESGYKTKISYKSKNEETNNVEKKQRRRRKIIWYNPPFKKKT